MGQEENPAATHTSPFETIRRVNDDGTEYWSARDLSKILGYTLWQKFKNVVEKAQEACQNSGQGVSDHFIQVDKMIKAGKGAKRRVEDIHLSRPEESIQQLQQKEQKQLKQGSQLSMFEEPT
jgi:prophage antirepressor-like protein